MRTLQSQAEWCNKVQWILGLSLAVMVVTFYAFIYRPNSVKLADLQDHIASQQRDLNVNKDRAQILPSVTRSVREMRDGLATVDAKLPRQPELASFIHDITDLSHQEGIRTKWDVEPGVSQRYDGYVEYPFSLKFDCDFSSAFSFLRRVEKMDRLTRVKSMKLSSQDNGKSGQVRVELTMNIYSLEG